MTQPGYVFIVGSSRTGTSVLRSTLNCSDDVAICNETHFFGGPTTAANLLRNILGDSGKVAQWGETLLLRRLATPGLWQKLAEVGDISTDVGAKKIVDTIYDSCGRWAPERVGREDFLRRLLASDRSERSLFDLCMTLYANGKPIRGEKTPAHVHYVPTLLEWFPNAKIIHTFRDPRTIFVLKKREPHVQQSYTRRYRLFQRSTAIFELYLSLDVIITWLRVVQLHHQYQQRCPGRYYLLKSEDLVSDPRAYLKRLCDFLEIDFTEGMLQRAVQDPDFRPCAQVQDSGASASTTDCWRGHLHPVTNRWFVWLCRKHLVEFGYPLW
jgi:hypothetical protein